MSSFDFDAAYRALRGMARNGQEYTAQQLFPDSKTPDAVGGHGFTLVRELRLNPRGQTPFTATASLRVVYLVEGMLDVHASLQWDSPSGPHCLQAEDRFMQIGRFFDTRQNYAGPDNASADMRDKPDAVSELAFALEPDMLCMLEPGTPKHPEQRLVVLAKWALNQPQAVVLAYEALRSLASHGRAYAAREVFVDRHEDDIIARGYDLPSQLEVMVDNTPIVITASLRVLDTTDGKLLLRTRIQWEDASGSQHESYACYQVSPEAAETLQTLAQTPPEGNQPPPDYASMPDDELALAWSKKMTEVTEAARLCDAIWQQHIGRQEDPDIPQTDDEIRAAQAAAAAAVNQHKQAVLAAQAAEPDMLCMLSGLGIGMVGPDEFGRILAWLAAQRKIAMR